MRSMRWVAGVLLVSAALASGPARANMCQAGPLTCGTAMPVGGYCECSARGDTQSGEVVSSPMRRRPVNSTAGGCGTTPNAPGCR